MLTAPGRPPLAVNETAAALWELCDGTTTVGEMVAAMDRFFDANSTEIRRGVETTLADFHGLGHLQWDDTD